MTQASVRTHVLEGLRSGTLPREAARALVGAFGNGHACDVCGEPTLPSSTTYRMRLGSGAGARSAYMHCHCFETWDELRRAGAAASPESV
jgi:hypothetical protein